tara:strand:- start:10092 stop:10541 length:450 start_codon:yes stop_codon:yes gene_type:complete
MQLTQFTDYSLRALIYIALQDGKTCTIAEIALSYNISKNHLMKVVHQLSKHNILKTIRGKGGGLLLNTTPDLINLGNLVQKIEPNFFIVECFDKRNNKCVISPVCKLKKILCEAKKNFIQTLEQYTLRDIIQNNKELENILIKPNNKNL